MLKKALFHFKKNDIILYKKAIEINFSEELEKSKKEDYFLDLCQIIISQQLSSKAAESIFNRFKKIFSEKITPDIILKTSNKKLKDIGLSKSKINYIKNIAQVIKNKKIDLNKIDSMSDSEIKRDLIQIKGIGPWTVEMFLMFSLGRSDIFSYGDLGLKKAIKKIYGFKKNPSQKIIEKISKKWSPYRTYASLILWKSLEA